MGKGKRKTGQCAYCGEIKHLTRDHVIPLSLFTQPLPANLITVPACDNCNNAKSLNDDFLRDFLVCDVLGNQHPIAQNIFEEKVLSSQRQDSSVIAREILSKGKLEPFHTLGGIYLGDFPTTELDERRINAVFSTVVRGLYYSWRKQRIPDHYSFQIRRHFPWDWEELRRGLQNFHLCGPRVLGEVFGCTFTAAKEDPFTSIWLLWFYNTILLSVGVTPTASQFQGIAAARQSGLGPQASNPLNSVRP